MDLRDVARYCKAHPAAASHDQITRLAMGYLELRDAMQPMLDEHTELRAYTVKLLTTIRGPLHELGPILARLHELVGAELPRG